MEAAHRRVAVRSGEWRVVIVRVRVRHAGQGLASWLIGREFLRGPLVRRMQIVQSRVVGMSRSPRPMKPRLVMAIDGVETLAAEKRALCELGTSATGVRLC